MKFSKEEAELFVGERIDPSMFSLSFFLHGKLRLSDHIRTPWGIWHTIQIHESRYKFARSTLNLGKDAKVLDIACGTGYGNRFMNEIDWFGVDLKREALDFGVNYNNNNSGFKHFINADAVNIPFANGSFDAVTSFETMEHIRFEKVSMFVAGIKSVLKPRGKFIMSIPNRDFLYPNTSIYTAPEHLFHFFEPILEELKSILGPHFSNIEYFYQTGRYLRPKNKLLTLLNKGINVAKTAYTKVKPIKFLDNSKEIAGVYLAVCSD